MARADTTRVAGTVSGEWTAAGNPYIVTDTVWINANDSLVIGPGVQILIQQPNGWRILPWLIDGGLIINGAEQDSVQLTAMDTCHWWGLEFRGSQAYCLCNYLVLCDWEEGISTSGVYRSMTFQHSSIRDQYIFPESFPQIGSSHTSVTISDCRIEIFEGFLVGGTTLIENTRFIGVNRWETAWPLGISSTNARIQNCRFETQGTQAISIDSYCSDLVIENCLFTDQASNAIYIIVQQYDEVDRNLRFLNNTFAGPKPGAIEFVDAGPRDSMIILNNLFTDASLWAIAVYQDFDAARYQIANNCFWNNRYNFQVEDTIFNWPGFGSLIQTNRNGDSTDIYGNIFMYPLFDGSDAYGLSEDSPCIDAGIDVGLPYAGAAPDMGYFEFGIEGTSRSRFILPPSSFILSCFPNPFNSSTRISFNLPKTGYVDLSVYDVTGRLVRRLAGGHMGPPLQAGTHDIAFDGRDLPSGIYFVALQSGELSQTQKIVLLK